jgi:hypothetical protein
VPIGSRFAACPEKRAREEIAWLREVTERVRARSYREHPWQPGPPESTAWQAPTSRPERSNSTYPAP